MKKKIFAGFAIFVFLLATLYHSAEVFPEQIKEPPKTHEEHWEEALDDLQDAFDLSEEEVTDLRNLIF